MFFVAEVIGSERPVTLESYIGYIVTYLKGYIPILPSRSYRQRAASDFLKKVI
jgi:hypothetical protein